MAFGQRPKRALVHERTSRKARQNKARHGKEKYGQAGQRAKQGKSKGRQRKRKADNCPTNPALVVFFSVVFTKLLDKLTTHGMNEPRRSTDRKKIEEAQNRMALWLVRGKIDHLAKLHKTVLHPNKDL